MLGQESCRTKVSRIFRNFVPNFAPNFAPNLTPNFSRIFRASFRGRWRPEEIHQKSPPFFNAKFPGKHEKNIHKILLESRQSKSVHHLRQAQRDDLEQLTGDKEKQYPPFFNYYIHILIFSNLLELDITSQLHCSNYLELIGST